MINGATKKYFYPHRGSGCSVLPGLMAGQNRDLYAAERMGLDCRARHRGCHCSGRAKIAPALQGHAFLMALTPARRTLPLMNGGWT